MSALLAIEKLLSVFLFPASAAAAFNQKHFLIKSFIEVAD